MKHQYYVIAERESRTYALSAFSANSAALRDISNARRASPEAADTFLAINSTASDSKDTKPSSLFRNV